MSSNLPDFIQNDNPRLRELLEEEFELAELDLEHDKIVVPPSLFDNLTPEELLHPDEFILSTMMDPEHFSWTIKVLFDFDLLPFQAVILKELWNHSYSLMIAGRGSSKTTCLGIYSVLRSLFLPGRKIIITGASWRQSKEVFKHAASLWDNSAILREICGAKGSSKQGPHYYPDEWVLKIGESEIFALPVGTGNTIRGKRANDIIADEFSAQNVDIFEEVIVGFASVKQAPALSVRERMREKKRERFWMIEDSRKKGRSVVNNQLIISGTAKYTFNHFYKYYTQYKDIIMTGGDRKKLEKIGVDPNLNVQDFCIIRIPIELVPDGFMDESYINRSRATMSTGIYNSEYGACILGDVEVITDYGLKKIKDVEVGDLVLTHKGRLKKVIAVSQRLYEGEIISFLGVGNNQPIEVTPNHPFLYDNCWVSSSNIENKMQFCHLQELNSKTEIDFEDFVDYLSVSIVDDFEYVYPTWSNSNSISQKKINNRKFRSCMPKKIKLDYYFGLIIGYYAAEGSKSASGGAISFSLDGHVDLSLEYFRQELKEAIKIVFDYNALEYKKKGNVVEVNINSRIVCDLISSICPGLAHTKYINPNILYSNKEFIKGVLTGYWHGDGCISKNSPATATCVNKNLLSQIRLCLSHFGFISYLRNSKPSRIDKVGSGEKLYNLKPQYSLGVSRKQKESFIKFTSDINYYPENNNNIIDVRIDIKEIGNFSGPVYNLEVEEDNSYSLINAVVHNCFISDSKGFFRRSLIEKCSVKYETPTIISGREIEPFHALINGYADRKYIYGVDPAARRDNFAIVILELHPDHRRVVYCWASNQKRHKEILKMQQKSRKNDAYVLSDDDFYAFCARKLRNLMKTFPCYHLAMDSQGGGNTINNILHSSKHLDEGEVPIWELNMGSPLWDKKQRDDDFTPGQHILEMVEFANANYTSNSHHGLKNDLEQNTILFPFFDEIELVLANKDDQEGGRDFDTLEDVINDIEELKNELTYIDLIQLPSGRERWDIPNVKGSDDEKGVLHKDRASALIMANYAARRLMDAPKALEYKAVGGYVRQIEEEEKDKSGIMYVGPSWITQYLSDMTAYGIVKKDDYQ